MNTAEKLIALKTLFVREVWRFIRLWTQTIIPPLITQSLYLMIFGALLGKSLPNVSGVPYLEFLIPGMIIMAIINSVFINVSMSLFYMKFIRCFEELIVSGMPDWTIWAGFSLGATLRGLIIGTLVLGISMFFYPITIANVGLLLSVALLTCLLLSSGGFLSGLLSKNWDDSVIVPTFVLTPLTYVGGVFYSIDKLPDFWKTVSLFNPIYYLVDTFRASFIGYSEQPIGTAISILVLLNIVAAFACLFCLKKGYGYKS